MKLCPHCRLAPGVMRAGLTGTGGMFVSWACDPCQTGVDQALAALAVLHAIRSGQVGPGILTYRGR